VPPHTKISVLVVSKDANKSGSVSNKLHASKAIWPTIYQISDKKNCVGDRIESVFVDFCEK
jgi:hypothetical protein